MHWKFSEAPDCALCKFCIAAGWETCVLQLNKMPEIPIDIKRYANTFISFHLVFSICEAPIKSKCATNASWATPFFKIHRFVWHSIRCAGCKLGNFLLKNSHYGLLCAVFLWTCIDIGDTFDCHFHVAHCFRPRFGTTPKRKKENFKFNWIFEQFQIVFVSVHLGRVDTPWFDTHFACLRIYNRNWCRLCECLCVFFSMH